MSDVEKKERVFQNFDGQQYEYIEGEHSAAISESNVAENANTKTESAAGQIPANEGKPIDDNAVKASPESSAQKSESSPNDDNAVKSISLEDFKSCQTWIKSYLEGELDETLAEHLTRDIPKLLGVDVLTGELNEILCGDDPFPLTNNQSENERLEEFNRYLAGRNVTITADGKSYTTNEIIQRLNLESPTSNGVDGAVSEKNSAQKSEKNLINDVSRNEEFVQSADNANAKTFWIKRETFNLIRSHFNQFAFGNIDDSVLNFVQNDLLKLTGVDINSAEMAEILSKRKLAYTKFNKFLSKRKNIIVRNFDGRDCTVEEILNIEKQAALNARADILHEEKLRLNSDIRTPPSVDKTSDATTGYDVVTNAEYELLAQMLLKGGESVPKIAAMLQADYFSSDINQKIYESVTRTYEEGLIPSISSILDDFYKTGYLTPLPKDIRKLNYILTLGDAAFTNATAETHAAIIRESALKRKINQLSNQLANDATNANLSADEILKGIEKRTLELRNAATIGGRKDLTNLGDFMETEFEKYTSEFLKYSGRSFGLTNLDAKQIFVPGLYFFGGVPGAGKSTLVLQMADTIAELRRRDNGKVFYFSYEMSLGALSSKIVARRNYLATNRQTKLTVKDIAKNATSPTIEKIKMDLRARKNFIASDKNPNVDELIQILRGQFNEKEPPPLVCIDYLQLMPPPPEMAKKPNLSAREKADDIVNKLLEYSRATGTQFFIISAFNRAGYRVDVSLESFKDSGGIEYAAVMAGGLNYRKNSENQDIRSIRRLNPIPINFSCVKCRDGSLYDVGFDYFGDYAFFQPIDLDEVPSNDGDDADEI